MEYSVIINMPIKYNFKQGKMRMKYMVDLNILKSEMERRGIRSVEELSEKADEGCETGNVLYHGGNPYRECGRKLHMVQDPRYGPVWGFRKAAEGGRSHHGY